MNKFRFKILIVNFLIFYGLNLSAQAIKTVNDSIPYLKANHIGREKYLTIIDSLRQSGKPLLEGTEFKGQTLPSMQFEAVTVTAPDVKINKKQYEKYSKLSWYVRSVYPYSQLIKKTYSDIQDNLKNFKTDKEKKEYIKKAEKELRAKFEGELVKLSVTQGKILVKLVDRELGVTTFEVIKEFRGPFQAFVWQSVAKMFGNNLKANYDRFGDDAMIEDIIIRIESGQ
jgi:hypothetical protein